MIGLSKINLTIGGNVTNDFLDNLANHQYQKMHKNEYEKITPETYKKMNKEFEEDGTAFRVTIPTQKEIDEWRKRN